MQLYVDMISGISGDMMLGALVDLGVPLHWLKKELSGVFQGFDISMKEVSRHHLRAVDIEVVSLEDATVSRHYSDIKRLVEKTALPLNVREGSLKVFEKIARAEAKIHQSDIERVHFHEVGGIDSLVDIIGTFLALDYLKIDKVFASVVPLGSGTIKCAHGVLPVPVPAVLEILTGIPTVSSGATTEIVTPTGAGLITILAIDFGPMPDMVIRKTGYGAGKRDTGLPGPNLLRVIMGEPLEQKTSGEKVINQETISVLRTNIDDMAPEIYGYLMDTLLSAGALDVSFAPVQMKKNRPGVKVEVLSRPKDKESLVAILLSETTSTGVRCHTCERFFLERQVTTIKSAFGLVKVKKIREPHGRWRVAPEYDDARRAAETSGMALKDVYQQILRDAAALDMG